MTVSVGPVKGHSLNLSELRSDTQASVRGLCRAHSAGSCLDVADASLNLGRAQDQRSLYLHCLSSRELDHSWAQSSRQANFLLSQDREHQNLEEDLAVLRMCHGSSPVRKFGL